MFGIVWNTLMTLIMFIDVILIYPMKPSKGKKAILCLLAVGLVISVSTTLFLLHGYAIGQLY